MANPWDNVNEVEVHPWDKYPEVTPTDDMSTWDKIKNALEYGASSAAHGISSTAKLAFGPNKLSEAYDDLGALVSPDKDYTPASEGLGNKNLSLWDRAKYLPRAALESAPGLAADLAAAAPFGPIGGIAAFSASHAARTAGDNVQTAADARTGTQGSQPTPDDIKRGLLGTAVDTALSRFGVGGVGGTVAKSGMDAALPIIKSIGTSAARDAGSSALATGLDKAIIENKNPLDDPNGVLLSAGQGALTGAVARLPQVSADTRNAIRFKDIAGPEGDKIADLYDGKDFSNARAAGHAVSDVDKTLDQNIKDWASNPGVKGRLNELQETNGYKDDTPQLLSNVRSQLEAGERANPEMLQALDSRIGMHDEGGNLMDALRQKDTHNQIKQFGNYQPTGQGGPSFGSGILGSPTGDILNPAGHTGRYIPLGALGGASALHILAGPGMMLPHLPAVVGGGLLAAQAAGNIGARTIDSLMGQRNILKAFTDRYGTNGTSPGLINLDRSRPSWQQQQADMEAAQQAAKGEAKDSSLAQKAADRRDAAQQKFEQDNRRVALQQEAALKQAQAEKITRDADEASKQAESQKAFEAAAARIKFQQEAALRQAQAEAVTKQANEASKQDDAQKAFEAAAARVKFQQEAALRQAKAEAVTKQANEASKQDDAQKAFEAAAARVKLQQDVAIRQAQAEAVTRQANEASKQEDAQKQFASRNEKLAIQQASALRQARAEMETQKGNLGLQQANLEAKAENRRAIAQQKFEQSNERTKLQQDSAIKQALLEMNTRKEREAAEQPARKPKAPQSSPSVEPEEETPDVKVTPATDATPALIHVTHGEHTVSFDPKTTRNNDNHRARAKKIKDNLIVRQDTIEAAKRALPKEVHKRLDQLHSDMNHTTVKSPEEALRLVEEHVNQMPEEHRFNAMAALDQPQLWSSFRHANSGEPVATRERTRKEPKASKKPVSPKAPKEEPQTQNVVKKMEAVKAAQSTSKDPTLEDMIPHYKQMVKEQKGFSGIPIHAMQKKTGWPLEKLHNLLYKEAKAGNLQIYPTTSVEHTAEEKAAEMHIPGIPEAFFHFSINKVLDR